MTKEATKEHLNKSLMEMYDRGVKDTKDIIIVMVTSMTDILGNVNAQDLIETIKSTMPNKKQLT